MFFSSIHLCDYNHLLFLPRNPRNSSELQRRHCRKMRLSTHWVMILLSLSWAMSILLFDLKIISLYRSAIIIFLWYLSFKIVKSWKLINLCSVMCCAYMSMVSWQNWLINCDWTFVHRIRRPQGCDSLSGMETKIQTRNTLAHVLHHPSFIITMYLVTFIIVIVIIFNVTRNETKKAELEACAALADNFKSGAQQSTEMISFCKSAQ